MYVLRSVIECSPLRTWSAFVHVFVLILNGGFVFSFTPVLPLVLPTDPVISARSRERPDVVIVSCYWHDVLFILVSENMTLRQLLIECLRHVTIFENSLIWQKILPSPCHEIWYYGTDTYRHKYLSVAAVKLEVVKYQLGLLFILNNSKYLL